MSLDLKELLLRTGALLDGHFRLSSGLHSPNYVQCARLLEHPSDARLTGQALAAKIEPWSPTRIVAPAMGGIIIGYAVAEALNVPMVFTERKDGAMQFRRGFSVNPDDRVVIVEDVVTTGKSTMETVAAVDQCVNGSDDRPLGTAVSSVVVGFASILNRSGRDNPFNGPYAFLLAMNLETFVAQSCPLCAQGVPLAAPGSRHSGGP